MLQCFALYTYVWYNGYIIIILFISSYSSVCGTTLHIFVSLKIRTELGLISIKVVLLIYTYIPWMFT